MNNKVAISEFLNHAIQTTATAPRNTVSQWFLIPLLIIIFPPFSPLPSSSLWAAAVLDFFLPHSNDRISPERKGSPKIFTHHKNFGGCHLPLAGKARALQWGKEKTGNALHSQINGHIRKVYLSL